jgi:alpha-N-arabinofuranosidase
MYISFDEWAPPFRGGHLSTLALTQFFNTFLRNADYIKMANYTLLTSLLGRDPQTGATYKSPLFHAFKLYSTRCHGESLRPSVVCDTFGVDEYYTAIPYLDVSIVHNPESRQVFINVVNRHKDEAIATDIASMAGAFKGSATVTQILSDDISNAPYTYEARDSYAPKVSEIPVDGSTLHCSFPAHSFTQIVVGLDRS